MITAKEANAITRMASLSPNAAIQIETILNAVTNAVKTAAKNGFKNATVVLNPGPNEPETIRCEVLNILNENGFLVQQIELPGEELPGYLIVW